MAENIVFDKLASNLPLDERQSLLEKLKSHSSIPEGILYFDDREDVFQGDMKTEFAALPWYSRLWYFILSFFKAKPPAVIYGDYRVSNLGQKINQRSPQMYNYQQRMLLSDFYHQVQKLKDAARFFYTALDISVNRDKGAFFAFLASLELPNIHKRIEAETTPNIIVENRAEMPEMELRQIAFKAMDDELALINGEQRDTMYSAARSLSCLKGLSSFLFDRLVMAFNVKDTQKGATCSANIVKELLLTLNNILFSLKTVPPMTLLQSLFVFILQERSDEPGFDINREIRLLLAKAEEALAVIRDFNRKVPLAWIIRCSTRNMSFVPQEISGGEDWFLVYRDYWRRRIETSFADYFKDRRRKEILESFRHFLKGQPLQELDNIQSDRNSYGLPVKGAFALSFLLTFYSVIFMPSINKILRPILIDGQFSRKENRVEFTEAYNNLMKLEEEIKKFEHEVSLSGEYGKRYLQARQEVAVLPVKRRRIQIVLEDAREDAEKILEPVRKACRSMVNFSSALLEPDIKAKNDILTNFPSITGKGSEYTDSLKEAREQFQVVIKLLDDIQVMEEGR